MTLGKIIETHKSTPFGTITGGLVGAGIVNFGLQTKNIWAILGGVVIGGAIGSMIEYSKKNQPKV